MTLPKNLTIITSFLFTSKKVDIFLQKTYIFWQICVLLNAKPERDTNVLNIRHSEVSSLFPQVSWSKISYVSKNKRVAKHIAFFDICCLLFQRVPESDIFVSFHFPQKLYYKRTICFFRVYLAKERYFYKWWWNLSLDIVSISWLLLFSLQVGKLVNTSVGNEHIWLLKNARYLEW